ncbi:glycosyltransferase family 2 protein [uncultured Brevundimonas sp.]|uniref:glycosyltransferase family 2 protein n=1 Tax=uncultured Brevundimonas sp. TaxID=213418 RepID=UPI0030ECFA4D
MAVIIPTLRRPEGLTRALESLFVQTEVADRLCEIVVVDNDPAGTAAATVEGLRPRSPWPLVYCHAPVPGVATARNVGLQATDAPLIAFLDDDEVATPDWLAQLLMAQTQTGADVVFGPIRGRAPGAADWLRPYLEDFFGRAGPASTRVIDQPFGCGNSLMVRRSALPGLAPFDVGADQVGGEDDALFAALADRGGRFGWAAGAWVDEIAPAHRATLRYALARAFAFGQGPSQTAAARRDWLGVVRWMVIGAAQMLLWTCAAVPYLIVRSPRRAWALDRMARGLGKLFWMKGLEPHFYGTRELTRLDAAAR